MTTAQVLDRIVQEQGAMIKRIASSYEANPHLVEELVQDIYLAIWRALPSFRGNSQLRIFVARQFERSRYMRYRAAISTLVSFAVSLVLPVGATGDMKSLAEMIDLAIARAERTLKAIRLGFYACAVAAVLGLAGTAIRTYLSRPPSVPPIVDVAVLATLELGLFLYARHTKVDLAKYRCLRKALM